MKTFKMIIALVIILSSQIISQEKLFTVDDVVSPAFGRSSAAGMRQLNWIPNTDIYAWVEGAGEKSILVASSPKNTKIDTLLRLNELNSVYTKENEKALLALPMVNWSSAEEFNFWSGSKYYSYNIKLKKLNKIISVPNGIDNQSFSPDQKLIAYTKDNNLFLNSADSKEIQITSDKDTNIVNGQAAHRSEFGINGGIFWSPNSNYIAFYRMDQTMVTDYPLVELTYTPARLKFIKYPMAGQTSHHVTVGIYEVKTGKTTWLKTGEPLDQYLTNLAWSPDEKTLFIAHLNRDQNFMQMKKYNISTGEMIKVLFEEKNDKYVEPLNTLVFLPNSNDKFIWQSQRNGFNHLYLYDVEGRLIKQVTDGNWVVLSINGFDKAGKNIYINSTKETPLEIHYYKVNIENGKMDRLTKDSGTHFVSASSNYEYFIDTYSNIKTPRLINLINKKGGFVRNLLTTDNPYKDYKMGEIKIFTIKNEEGTELFCRMVTPPNFDQTKKYPVIFYVYGGPHDQEVTNSFGTDRYFKWFCLMAQKGFIVFTLDNRGSLNRGLDFEQATFRHLGTNEVKDQMSGVNYLKTLPYVDANRFGVYGWSYGGFMATSLMLRTNGTFKVGVGGGSVIDWKFYEIMYGERYMDTPQTNPEGYKEASLLNYAQNLKGKLLLVHGTSDPTVVWQNDLLFAKKCSELNIPLDYYPYIGSGHGVGGRDALQLYNKITSYFVDNL
jgi:dipeptidyl-peptidase 4